MGSNPPLLRPTRLGGLPPPDKMEKNMNTYEPQSVSDVIFGSADGQYIIDEITNGNIPFPNTGKNGFLIHGPFGTGKTTLAKLLPSEIERLAGYPAPAAWFREADEDGAVNGKMLKSLATASQLVSLEGCYNHFIIDELDLLSKEHQRKLRNIMNTPNGVFYYTTNAIGGIDSGVRNRCHEINLCAADARKWLPLFARIIRDRGASTPSEATLLPLIEGCHGSVRDIVTAAHILASKRIASGLAYIGANSDVPEQSVA